MKTIPPPCPVPDTGPKYWRSLDQLADTPEFRQWAEREFPSGASELTDPVTRRSFVKLMSASCLLAGFGLTGCRKPVENIYPFSKMPEGYVHGVAKFYATSMPTRGSAVPLLARSDDGRPTKVEGNPDHPDSNGGTDRYTQASILNLYDPDRSTRFAKDAGVVARETVLDFLSGLSKESLANGGQGLAFLAEQSSSPSRERLVKMIGEKLPQARWYEFEPVDFSIHRQAATIAFGQPVTPYFKIDNAKAILSLDCDFIGGEEDLHVTIRRFANGRRITTSADSMSRLYAIEAMMTLTGANADHRLRAPASAIPAITARFLVELLGSSDAAVTDKVRALAAAASAHEKWIVPCAKDLLANKGKSLVMAGHGQPLAVHLMVNAINSALGNVGSSDNMPVILLAASDAKPETIAQLAQSLDDGKVETLFILGGNPVYNAPADLNWAAAQAKAKTIVRLGYYEDESFPQKGWSLPLAHYLESWGDARTSDGTFVSVQPLIEPLFGGMTELEVLGRIVGLEKTNPYDIVRETFLGLGKGGEEEWKKFLHDGFLANSAQKTSNTTLNTSAVTEALAAADLTPAPAPSKDKLEVLFHRDSRMDDGRFNNNGWMQELPDPITKMTWENVILMSVKTAEDLGLVVRNKENNRIRIPWVKIELDGRTVEGPAWTQPGQADNVLALALGYGRAQTGRVGKNSGYDAYRLRTTKSYHLGAGAKLSDTGTQHSLSITQDHGTMEGRPVIREATLKQFAEHPKFARAFDMPKPPVFMPMYPNPFDEFKKKGHHQWGMSVDLSACVGCSSCVIACQSENNIPIVGKQQVANNREMHWLRVDRYYTGPVSDPQMVTQPMFCQHCEAAPCENVCPVNATTHDQEGLNVMIYNRCVGTRYCQNNCPYKVRRFNFFDYNRRTLEQLKGPIYSTPLIPTKDQRGVLDWLKDPDRGNKPTDEWELLKLVKNPQVTVRMRGVMEKCTYCIQRIQGAEIAQKVKAGATDNVLVPDGTIKTACQQACPAEAIVFGNIADPNSRVSKLKAQERDYGVLDFLNTKPRTTYLARIRNPNPEMPDAYKTPNSSEEFEKRNHQNPFEEKTEKPGGKEADLTPGKERAHV
jgi:molybdopterin-containing oxidoreductase family iron-sulfur binding subunit